MNKTAKLRGIRQTAIIFASLCCAAAALAAATPAMAASRAPVQDARGR